MADSYLKETETGLMLMLRVSPNAKRSGIEGLWNGTHIKVALQAPAVDGKANKALIDFLSETFKIKKNAIFLMTGETSRCKLIFIEIRDELKRQGKSEWLKQKLLTVNK